MKETQANSKIVMSLEKLGEVAEKIPDTPAGRFSGLRFRAKHPCDIWADIQTTSVAIETKLIKGFTKFDIGLLEDSQVECFEKRFRKKRLSFIFLVIQKHSMMNRKDRVHRIYIFDWFLWRDFFLDGNRITGEEMYDCLDYVEWKKGIYQLKPFIESVWSQAPFIDNRKGECWFHYSNHWNV